MAWFNPPLYKPGNKKCPNCGQRVSWTLFWFGDLKWGNAVWTKWPCRRCQSVLGWDLGRRAIIVVPIGALVAVTIAGATGTWPGWAKILLIAGWLVLALVWWWWFDSVVVRRPARAEATPPLKT
jgi:hypothetical protein